MRRIRGNFTVVELAVVLLILGLAAAVVLPRLRDSVERSRASQAFSYLSSVRVAQERFAARAGRYSNRLEALHIDEPRPRHFDVGQVRPGTTGGLKDSWTLTLTREGAFAPYGDYTIAFTETGWDRVNSSVTKLRAIVPARS